MENTTEAFSQKFYRLKGYHLLLWLGYYIFYFILYRGLYSSAEDLLKVISIYFVFNAIPFYIINYYLVPKFLSANRIGVFVLCTLITIVVSATLLSLLLFVYFKNVAFYNLVFSFIMGFSSVLLMVGVLSAVKVMIEKIRDSRASRLREHHQIKTELLYLRAQVNPHFLFNAINSIYVLILKDPGKAAETLIKLSDLLRFQLYDCTDERIQIESELTYIQNFITLEKLRRGERVQVLFEMEGDLKGFEVAPFLSVPFLENAFKFVSNYPDKRNEVRISMRRNDNNFEARFYNTKEDVARTAVGGIGLKNVIRRLELMYPGKHNIVFNDREDSWESILTLQLA